MANPYSVLGVPKNADEKAIKSAFRKMAKKYHPDQNQDDKSAKTRFAEVNQAYEILGDKEKRAQFDRGEIDEKGNPKFAGFGGQGGGDPFGGFRQQRGGGNPFGGGGGDPFGGAEDILSELFGGLGGARGPRGQARRAGTQPPKSPDLELQAVVGLDELMRGKATVRMPDGKQLAISIPPEASDGQVIRLKGKGHTAPGRPPGDAKVKLKIISDPKFSRDGADLRHDAPIDLETAVLGGKTAVSTPDGKISLKIPEGTNSGKVFRLKGKGLPKKSGGQGDLLVSIQIQIPEEHLEDLQKFFKTK